MIVPFGFPVAVSVDFHGLIGGQGKSAGSVDLPTVLNRADRRKRAIRG
jgi:hypothetical protein